MLRNLPNTELIHLYDSELVLRLHNAKNLRDTSAHSPASFATVLPTPFSARPYTRR